MSVASTQDDASRTEPPLWSIGLAVLIILAAPLVLYSLAPPGPLREGDTVFSEGQQRVLIAVGVGSASFQQEDSCLLDPGSPLIIIRTPTDRPDGMILAQVQGHSPIEWPFCRPPTEVLLATHQTFQKPDILKGIKEAVAALVPD
jgi:hypothetical protein